MGKSNKVALVCQVCGATFYKVPSAITMETRCCITAKVPVWPEYQPRIGATYRAERYPMFKAPGYVIESGGKRINIRADECVEI